VGQIAIYYFVTPLALNEEFEFVSLIIFKIYGKLLRKLPKKISLKASQLVSLPKHFPT
jgi:hypothetical protein